jgi:hypothetical protein
MGTDLVNCLHFDEPLAAVDATTLYGGSAAGCTDYPSLVASDGGSGSVESFRTLFEKNITG